MKLDFEPGSSVSASGACVSASLTMRINNTEIETVPSFKTLGVYFTEHMSWDKHVNYIVGKLSGVTGCLRQHCLYFPVSVNVIFYNCLFSSLLSYGALV